MAAPAALTPRARLDAALDRLAAMLPDWREKLRHEAQFWPQFDALSQEIVEAADAADRPHAQRRIAAMLAEQGLDRGDDAAG